MKLNSLQLLTLSSLDFVGNTKVLKVGNYLLEHSIKCETWDMFIPILESLKIKTKVEGVKGTVKIELEHLLRAERKAKSIIENSQAQGIGIVTYFEDSFPDILRKTINEEGKLDPPIVLFYKGDLSVINMPGLAVIGTREVTEFGKNAGMILTKEFAKKGFCIVSGLAIGCDTIGHRAALAVGGRTVAFLAHGLDTIYPPENTELAKQIVDNGGLLLSEYPIGMGVNRYNLVARDRLQAGLSLATLVIQTGEHGGTMHAANTTLEAQKPLYTIKFQHQEQNEHEKSLGNALLVKKGAKYIAGSDDFERIAQDILNYQKPQTSLFD